MPSIHSKQMRHQRGAIGQVLALFMLALIFSSLVVAIIGYKFGYRQGAHSVEDNRPAAEASVESSELVAENNKLKQDIATANQERDISMSNLENLRTQIEDLKTTNLQLEQVNEILKSSVAEQGGVALNIIASEIISLPDNTFEYRFDVAMIDISGKAVKMIPKLTLLNATNMVEIPLDPASYDIKGVANIRGRFIMPEGFEPKQMKIELTAGTQKVQQLYNWQIGKIITDESALSLDKSTINHRPIAKTNQ